MRKTQRACKFAVKAHGNQKYGKYPYSYHLSNVVVVLYRFSYHDEELLCAAWLHDVVEDTEVSLEAIQEEFGSGVSNLVGRVTNEEGRTRADRCKKTYPKISGNENSIVLKLADRIANVEQGLKSGHSMLSRYQKEFPGFKEALHKENHAEELWLHLESLLKGI